jgi:hypothetical protein
MMMMLLPPDVRPAIAVMLAIMTVRLLVQGSEPAVPCAYWYQELLIHTLLPHSPAGGAGPWGTLPHEVRQGQPTRGAAPARPGRRCRPRGHPVPGGLALEVL